jgi:hypothetical protein
VDVDTAAVHGELIRPATPRTAPRCSVALPSPPTAAGSAARSHAGCISPTSRVPRSPSGTACLQNAGCRPHEPSPATTTSGSSSSSSPTSALPIGWRD